jgi:glycosyltransferase involved in cell wall biosynthesis
MLKGQPRRNGLAYYEEMENKVRELTCNQRFDIIQIEQSSMAPYVEFISDTNNRAARLINLYDVGAAQFDSIAKVQADFRGRFWSWFDSFFLRRWESNYVASHFDKCTVVSAVDGDILRRGNPNLEPVVVPNGVDTTQHPLLPQPTTLNEIIFVGNMRYMPNVDGAIFFCKEVFPLIKRKAPGVTLSLVGSTPIDVVQSLAAEDVIVTGYVESVMPYYQQAVASVVPLRAGSGTRLKILESMALGRAVVSTTLGCEGLTVTHGKNILIADSPTDFADQTIRLLNDHELRQQLVTNARHLVETLYDWQASAQRLLQVYDEIVDKRRVHGM